MLCNIYIVERETFVANGKYLCVDTHIGNLNQIKSKICPHYRNSIYIKLCLLIINEACYQFSAGRTRTAVSRILCYYAPLTRQRGPTYTVICPAR